MQCELYKTPRKYHFYSGYICSLMCLEKDMTITHPQMQSTTSYNNLCEKYKLDRRKQLPVPAGDKGICPIMLLNHESVCTCRVSAQEGRKKCT